MTPLSSRARAAAILLSLSLLLPSPTAGAQPAAVIDAVQMPAWVERGGVRTPIAPGLALRRGDIVHTGPSSRVLVRLAEGSLVKLGENGELRFARIQPERDVYRAALAVLKGAFRFTTDVALKARRRDVSISVATVTVGIRGTDLWGRSLDDTEIVCLIEGAIEVAAAGEQPLSLDQPRQFYRRVAGTAQPIGLVEPAQLQQWAEETEIQSGRGVARRGGRFEAVLARLPTQAAALALYDRVRAAGYPAEIRPVRQEAGMNYIVRIRNLASRAEVQALSAHLRGRFGMDSPAPPR